MSKEEDFIIDWTDPGNDRILACSSCSGHSFKFTPVLGKIFVDLLTKGKSIDLFEKYRHLFRIAYHQGVNLKPWLKINNYDAVSSMINQSQKNIPLKQFWASNNLLT